MKRHPLNPVPVQPVAAHPVVAQPAVAQPVVQPVVAQPVAAQPVVSQKAPVNPVSDPVVSKPVAVNSKPVFVVEADGALVTAVGVGSPDTVLITSTNPILVERVERAATFRSPVDYVWGVQITAGWDTPEGIVAALLHAVPGRTRLVRAPEETLDNLERLVGPVDPNVVY